MKHRRLRRIAAFVQGMGDAELGLYAASGAYFLFLSLVPLVVLACSVIPLTPLTQETVLDYLSAVLPDVMEELLGEIVDQVYGNTAALLSVSALLTLWSAGKAMLGLIRGLNHVYRGVEVRGYLRQHLRSVVYTILLLAFLLLSLLLSLGQRRLLTLLSGLLHKGDITVPLLRGRFPAAMLLLALSFTLMYKLLPSRKLRLSAQLPGGLLASALWMLLTWSFSFYIRHFGGSLYGSLATVVFAMFWIYLCLYILMLGGYFNAWLERQRHKV